ncbi:DUF1836 domain-containing protein [Bacillus sp. B-jedd]|uniref:DUF1836 domain-containing protein n=1 Tax=Bacillus sp. B-jedd TaxID=1476857 RepID=UPI0005155D60|nr:DUF1836 domain-containing protein [Bacillus sp. B-jedd]CEG25550.1 cytoplasmic protein [Bacillus sp. B-jedd]
MVDVNDLLDEIGLDKNLELDQIPAIDLYMDQVIQLFENAFAEAKRNEEEKILTKTMINNYAKDRLFFPVKKKKYTREHLILLSLIYQLKGTLTIGDIKGILNGINEETVQGNLDLEEFYSAYLNLAAQNTAIFRDEVVSHGNSAAKERAAIKGGDGDIEKVLLIASLANMSNMYKRLAERLADTLAVIDKEE